MTHNAIVTITLMYIIVWFRQKWIVKALDHASEEEKEYGYLIPQLRNLMSDLIPGCSGSSNDTTPYLTKGRSVDVARLSIEPLSTISVGVNWELTVGSNTDLDLGCLMVDANNNLVDLVNYQQLRSKCGAVRHGGDSRGDTGDGLDDELLNVHLDVISDDVRYIAFYLSSYKGNPMADIVSCGAHLYETDSHRDLALLDIYDPEMSRCPSVLLCMLVKAKSRWHFINLSEVSAETSIASNIKHLHSFIPSALPIQNLFAYELVSLVSKQEYRIDTSYMQSLVISVRWIEPEGVWPGGCGASIVMFDRQGKFIDGVDARRVRSRRGPLVTHGRIDLAVGLGEEYEISVRNSRQQEVFIYYVVLVARDNEVNLMNYTGIAVTVKDGDSKMEMCKYLCQVENSATTLVLTRLWKAPSNNKVTILYIIF